MPLANLAQQGLPEGELKRPEGELKRLPIERLHSGKYQPRREMNPESLQELAASIQQQGIMQPLVVRHLTDGHYEIIAGERRWRAAQLAGLETVPALVREAKDRDVIALALIENLQREDLNPLEEALALQGFQQEFKLSQQQLANAVGRSRSSVANLLRLLNLHKNVQRLLQQGHLEMGHARALLGLPEAKQPMLARQVIIKGLSVRQTEALVKKTQLGLSENLPAKVKDPDITRLEAQLQASLGASVKIRHSAKGAGKLEIAYSSLAELDGILQQLR